MSRTPRFLLATVALLYLMVRRYHGESVARVAGALRGRRKRLALTAIAAAGVFVALVPWTVHNWRTYQVVHPLTPTIAVLWQGSPEYMASYLWAPGPPRPGG